MLSTSIHAKTPTLHSGQKSWSVGLRAIFEQNLHEFFIIIIFLIFSFYRIFRFSLGPLYLISTSIRAKMPTLNSNQKFWPVRAMGIFIQNVPKFFFSSKEFYICFLDLHICYLQVFMQKCRHCIPVKILDWSVLGIFSYKIYPRFLFLFFISIEFFICFLENNLFRLMFIFIFFLILLLSQTVKHISCHL